jgi:uncharacterized protein (TIGR02996 family)
VVAWSLLFHHPEWLSLGACEQVVGIFVGGPISVKIGELEGNPRDFYTRPITITGQRGELRVELTTHQALRGPDEPEPRISSVNVALRSETATFAARLAAWRALTHGFAQVGAHDITLSYNGATIVDDAEAAGERETAAQLRAEIAAALTDQASRTASCYIRSPRIDVEPILAAYPHPERIVSFGLADCGLQALPANFARFPNIERLSLEEDAFDGSVLRGVSRPRLEWLTLGGKGLRRITRDDLAGFPALEVLSCIHSPLAELDPGILDVCPKLVRVYVDGTPLAADERAMARLRTSWPRMLWRYDDGHAAPPRPAMTAPPARPAPPAPPPPPFVVAPVDPTLRPFFAAILAAREDDAPRLALAQFLVDRGDPRGEQIRRACELAALDLDDPTASQLAARCQAMPQFSFFSGTRYPFLTNHPPRRGFVETIECSIRDFIAYGEQLMQDAPILEYLARGAAGEGPLLAACPTLARLRRLDLRWYDDRAAIVASPHLQGTLHELRLPVRLASAGDVAALAGDLGALSALRRLTLTGTLTKDAVPSLVELVESRGLERLELQFCTLSPTTILETLWAELGDERVRPRRVPRIALADGVLALPNLSSAEQLRALLATGEYRSAVELRLGHSSIGDALVAVIASSRALPALRELNLGGSNITDAGVHALAAQAVGLDALARIDLGVAPGGREPGGVSDAAAEALARSPRLPALTRIDRSIEHHVYAADARDDAEIVEIRRDDGRVVESVLGTSCGREHLDELVDAASITPRHAAAKRTASLLGGCATGSQRGRRAASVNSGTTRSPASASARARVSRTSEPSAIATW